MKKNSSQNSDDYFDRIMEGLKVAREKMVRFKRYKNTPIVISQDGKIVKLDPFKVKLKGE